MRSIVISSNTFFLISFTIFSIFKGISIFRSSEKLDFIRELFKIGAVCYAIGVISLVFFPVTFQFGGEVFNKYPTIWMNPLTSIVNIVMDNHLDGIIYNIGGNFILLAPMPLFLLYFFRYKVDNLVSMFFLCLFTAISIESVQFFESLLIAGVGRFIETNDIILNTSGGVTGYLLYDKLVRPYSYLITGRKVNNNLDI
ncbi:VanZ family protein [Clostridium tarantellae]|uniref:VanZ-like domain-containing protein n=1 Tax=Clostridium tarantellae TaxID=39493 RepID=A0A6I1MJ31_9CLOT|nr:VanZ family protein [Clostridium tarantellae]MPQ43546.1 hypothetical protein [Clostridium tarantellae]